jgi:ABC-type glycerol-3-phosphate transport system substrate-binding protein
MASRPARLPAPPDDWAASLTLTTTLAFPAADPHAFFTLLQYQSLGGSLLDDTEQPAFDTLLLTEVLSYYQQASFSGLMPPQLTQYENDAQSWEAYQQGQADIAITWLSRYLQNIPADTVFNAVATADGVPFTLADGWVWALTATDPDRQLLATQLAEFLTTGDYLSAWTAAGGWIPPRPSALEAWPDSPGSPAMIHQIASSAQLIPSLDIVTELGPLLQQAVVSILKAETDPAAAAEAAHEKLSDPAQR